MKNKFWYSVSGLLVILFITYYQQHHPENTTPLVSGVTYDKSIATIEGQPIKVVEAIDGDTIVLANGDHLRYIGIDTPEEFDPRKPVQCFAKEAADRNKQLVEGHTIIFHKDINETDKYGRWLGFVYLEDGTFVNEEMVKEGYAFSYKYVPDISKTAIFEAAQASAKASKLGLWGSCTVTTLKGGREQTNDLQ